MEIPHQDSIQVSFYWEVPDAVPPHAITDSTQIAAILGILQRPGDWHLERRLPWGEQRLFLAGADGERIPVWFCPRTIAVRGQGRRMVRSIEASTYDSLLLLTGSRPYYPQYVQGDTTAALRDGLCHMSRHPWWQGLPELFIFASLLTLFVTTGRWGYVRLIGEKARPATPASPDTPP